MPEEEKKQTSPVDSLGSLIDQVSRVDDKGKQANPVVVLVIMLVMCFVIAGIGISMALAKRKAVKAQYEADRAREEAKRAEVKAGLEKLEEDRKKLEAQAKDLDRQARAKEMDAASSKTTYENLVIELAAASSWDDIEVHE